MNVDREALKEMAEYPNFGIGGSLLRGLLDSLDETEARNRELAAEVARLRQALELTRGVIEKAQELATTLRYSRVLSDEGRNS